MIVKLIADIIPANSNSCFHKSYRNNETESPPQSKLFPSANYVKQYRLTIDLLQNTLLCLQRNEKELTQPVSVTSQAITTQVITFCGDSQTFLTV